MLPAKGQETTFFESWSPTVKTLSIVHTRAFTLLYKRKVFRTKDIVFIRYGSIVMMPSLLWILYFLHMVEISIWKQMIFHRIKICQKQWQWCDMKAWHSKFWQTRAQMTVNMVITFSCLSNNSLIKKWHCWMHELYNPMEILVHLKKWNLNNKLINSVNSEMRQCIKWHIEGSSMNIEHVTSISRLDTRCNISISVWNPAW